MSTWTLALLLWLAALVLLATGLLLGLLRHPGHLISPRARRTPRR